MVFNLSRVDHASSNWFAQAFSETLKTGRPGRMFSHNFCHAFYAWASGLDAQVNLIPCIDINKLTDWLND